MSKQALSEISSALGAIPPDAADRLCAEILQARRIACYGVGREGLMMNALCMRLMHLGLEAQVVGDMTAAPIGICAACRYSRRSTSWAAFDPDSALRRWGLKLASSGGKRGKKRAIVTVARKLAVMQHSMWRSGQCFQPFRNQ